MNVIGDTSDAVGFTPAIAAHCRQISVHSRPNGWVQPRMAGLCAKDDVKDYLTHSRIVAWRDDMKQAFSLQR